MQIFYSGPTPALTKEIYNLVKHLHNKGIVDNTRKDYLTFTQLNDPAYLKKIHTDPIAIVSGCGGPTERVSQLLDLHLQPFVPKIKSYSLKRQPHPSHH